MTPRQNENASPHKAEQQARAWLRHDAAVFDRPEVFAAFGAWLQADPRHRDAFIRLSLARRPAAMARMRASSQDIAAPGPDATAPGPRVVFALLFESVRSTAIFVLIGLAAVAIDFLVHVLQPQGLPPLLSIVIRGATLVILLADIAVLVLLQARAVLRILGRQRVRVPAREVASDG